MRVAVSAVSAVSLLRRNSTAVGRGSGFCAADCCVVHLQKAPEAIQSAASAAFARTTSFDASHQVASHCGRRLTTFLITAFVPRLRALQQAKSGGEQILTINGGFGTTDQDVKPI